MTNNQPTPEQILAYRRAEEADGLAADAFWRQVFCAAVTGLVAAGEGTLSDGQGLLDIEFRARKFADLALETNLDRAEAALL